MINLEEVISKISNIDPSQLNNTILDLKIHYHFGDL